MTARIITFRPSPIDPIRIETEQPMSPAPTALCIAVWMIVPMFWAFMWWLR